MDSGIKSVELQSPVGSDKEAEAEDNWIQENALDSTKPASIVSTAAASVEPDALDFTAGTSTNAVDSKTNSTSNSTRSKKLENFKKLIWAFQCFTILCVIGLFVAQIVTAHIFFDQSKKVMTNLALNALQEQFDNKREIILGFVENVDDNYILQKFLLGETYSVQDVEAILEEQTHLAQLEINTLLDAQGRIVASAADERYGDSFDPEGIVTKIMESFNSGDSENYISWVSEVGSISKAEFEASGGYTFKSVPADGYGQKYSLLHQDNGLVLYACGSIRFDNGTLAGIKVIGYVLSGKNEFVRDTLFLMELNAYGGIFQRNDDNSWKPVSFIRARGLSESSTHAEFDDDDNEILNEVYDSQSEIFHVHETADGIAFTVAYAPFPPGIQMRGSNEESTEKSKALFSVGTENARLDESLETTTVALIAFLCAIIASILVFASVSIRCFIDPLDRLVKAAHARDKAKTAEAFKHLSNSQWSVCIVGSGIMLTCALIVGMLLYNSQRIFSNFEVQSPERQRLQQFQFFAIRDQYEFFTHTKDLTLNPIVSQLFDGSNNEASSIIAQDLEELKEHHPESMFLVVNSSFQILASSHDLPSSSLSFDPKSIISKVLSSGESVRANILLENAFYLALNPLKSTDSAFQPEESGNLAAVVLIAAPIFGTSEEDVIGVAVVVTLLNANPVTAEDVEFGGEDGCAAIYYSRNGDFVLVASSFKSIDDSEVKHDVDVGSPALFSALEEAEETQEFVEIEELKVAGYEFEAGVNYMSPGALFDDHGHETLTREFDDPILLVQCSSLSRWRKLKSTVAAISSVTAIGYFLVAVILAYVTFKPIYDFGQRMGKNWGRKQGKGIILSISDAIPRLTTRSNDKKPGKSAASGSAIESMKV